ncbi:condensation domain-containing protein, partial [Undibacterium crateris]|uniref:condensation domain-containing protein n=1 Tax=Undibacterium crateris TaxID=2528175 RepID=UPI001F2C6398
PLNANGKLDVKALPPAQVQHYLAQQPYAAPVGELEHSLAAMWQELLKVDRVGRHDNFFELGGHSLLAVKLAERMRQHDWHVNISSLFARPTLAALAEAVEHSERQAAALQIPPNRIAPDATQITPAMLPLVQLTQTQIDSIVHQIPGGVAQIQDIYPLAPLQEGMLFHHMLESAGDAYLTSVTLGFHHEASLDGFLHALQSVVDRHDVLRTSMHWEGLDTPVQVVWRQASLIVEELCDTDSKLGVQAQLEARYDSRHYRLNLQQAPLLRAVCAYDPAQQRWLLLVLLHHLILDHASMELLMQEISLTGRGLQALLPAPLAFRDVVAHARLSVSSDAQQRFFTQMLGHIDEATAPFGVLDVRANGADMRSASIRLDAELARRLRVVVRQQGVGSASLMHLAWALVLAHTTGRDEPVFGTVLLGRMNAGAGADRALGLFINTLPLCVSAGQLSVEQALRITHARLAELLQHEHTPLSLAQSCSAVPAPLPLFTTLLNCRYVADKQPGMQDSAWPDIEMLGSAGASNYPITMSVDDQGTGFTLTASAVHAVSPEQLCTWMLHALEGLSSALEHQPRLACAQLKLLLDSERNLLLDRWQGARLTMEHGQRLEQQISIQASAT